MNNNYEQHYEQNYEQQEIWEQSIELAASVRQVTQKIDNQKFDDLIDAINTAAINVPNTLIKLLHCEHKNIHSIKYNLTYLQSQIDYIKVISNVILRLKLISQQALASLEQPISNIENQVGNIEHNTNKAFLSKTNKSGRATAKRINNATITPYQRDMSLNKSHVLH